MPRPTRTTVGATLVLAGVLGAGLTVGLIYVGSTHHGATYRCLVAGPSDALAASEGEDLVEGGFDLWSLGRTCEWQRADGQGTIVVGSGTPGSLLILTIAPAVGAALLTPRARMRAPRARVRAL